VPVEQWHTRVRPPNEEGIDGEEEQEVERVARQGTASRPPNHALRCEDDARRRHFRGDTGEQEITMGGHTSFYSKRRARISK